MLWKVCTNFLPRKYLCYWSGDKFGGGGGGGVEKIDFPYIMLSFELPILREYITNAYRELLLCNSLIFY